MSTNLHLNNTNRMSIDIYGRFASSLCVLHCLTMSFAPFIIESISILNANNELLEWGFFSLALAFALLSAVFGMRKHNNPLVLGSFAMGIAVLILGRLGEAMSLFEGGEALSIGGGAFLFVAHMYSARCCQRA